MVHAIRKFRFSWKITLFCVALSAVMVRCAFWQWDRYGKKVELVRTYETNATAEPTPLPADETAFSGLFDRKVSVKGHYDFSHQLIVRNKRHASGPGHHLFTPLIIDGTEKAIFVSRGFIPFADLKPDDWKKYNGAAEETVTGVLKSSVSAHLFGPSNPKTDTGFQTDWYFEEIPQMTAQLPYSAIPSAYVQRLGPPLAGEFPAEAVTIEVPPSTHFGYTIEWSILAVVTLLIGFFLQWFRPVGLAILLCALYPIAAEAVDDPTKVEQQATITEQLGSKIDLNLRFRDETGREIPLRESFIPNRPVILTPVYYTCPHLCTVTLNGVVRLLGELDLKLGQDFSIVSYSINPEETPELAASKASNYHDELTDPKAGERGWRFLTGSPESVKALSESIGFRYERDGKEYVHAAVIVLLTPEGSISRYFFGVQYPNREVRYSLVEASLGRIGTVTDRIFLFCFGYDHLTGKYSFLIWNMIRILSLICVLALGLMLYSLRRKELAVGTES